MPSPPPFAVISDLDGVLVDSEPLTIRAYVQAASEFGVHLDREEFVQRVITEGMLIQSLFQSRGGRPADWDALFRRKTELYRALVQHELRLLPGARELLADLHAHGVPCALATSASRITMEVVFAATGLGACFDATVTLEDVAQPKPHPEAFLKAAELLNASPAHCIVIEDALKGLAAAHAAGMLCVAVPTSFSRSEDLQAADLVVASLAQLTATRLAALLADHSPLLGCERHLVKLVPYLPAWAELFQQEAARVRAALGDQVVRIEHVGSTSVPGLDAKPILDLVVAVPDMTDAAAFEAALTPLGYLHKPDDEPSRLYFVKRTPEARSTHHLNLTKLDTECWFTHVAFRDYLRAHPEARDEYRRLKLELARQHPTDRPAYREGKAEFIVQTLEAAKREREQ